MTASRELSQEIELELSLLSDLLDRYDSVISPPLKKPDEISMLAIAGILNSFYNGVENILKRIAVRIDCSLPDGPS